MTPVTRSWQTPERLQGAVPAVQSAGYRDMEAACAALNQALPHAGQGFWMEPPFWCDYGWNLTAGKTST